MTDEKPDIEENDAAAKTDPASAADLSSGDETTGETVDLTMVDGRARAGAEAGASVKRVRFAPLPPGNAPGEEGPIDLLYDVQLNLSVELGRTTIPVREVLQLGPGAIVELEKVAGEPVDIYVNGKLLARGEVVVVDDSFGVRVTEIAGPAKAA